MSPEERKRTQRISWGALVAIVFLVAAIVSAVMNEDTLALVLGMGSISWALLSLREL